jgi:hypothetical protein
MRYLRCRNALLRVPAHDLGRLCYLYPNLVRFWRLTCGGMSALDGLGATRGSPSGTDIRVLSAHAGPGFVLRLSNVPVFGPFYFEAQPRLRLGRRFLAARLVTLHL